MRGVEVVDCNGNMMDLKLHEPTSAPRNRYINAEFPEDLLPKDA